MSTARISDQPSKTARMRYSLQKIQAPFRRELDGLSLSSTSSRDSLSLRTSSTAPTDVSEDDDFDKLEDLLVLSPSADTQRSWSLREQEYLKDLANHLHEEPSLSGHKYMIRLRIASKSGDSWRPCVLLLTQSAKTKLMLASYFLTGPPILRRLAERELDLHIIHSRFGLSSSAEDVEGGMCEHVGYQVYVDADIPTNGARLVVRHAKARKTTTAVAGGMLLAGDKTLIVTTYHLLESDDGTDEGDTEMEGSALASESTDTVDGAISVYHEDIADEIIRLDCVDATLDDFTSSVEQHKTANPPAGRATTTSISTHHKPLKNVFAAMKAKMSRAKVEPDDTIKASLHARIQTCRSRQPKQGTMINDSSLTAVEVVYTGRELDWAALELPSRHGNEPTPLPQVNRIGSHVIDSVHDIEVCDPIDVTLATTNGDFDGRLLPETVFYHAGQRELELQVVRLNKSLPRGTSGAWVTHYNHFCGIVIAISDDLPEAFILPASRLIDDIERVCGAKVTLPRALDIHQTDNGIKPSPLSAAMLQDDNTSVQHETTSIRPASRPSTTDIWDVGLAEMYSSPETCVDMIFVHGLSGLPYKTWSAPARKEVLWPQNWLPSTPGGQFQAVSCGYDTRVGADTAGVEKDEKHICAEYDADGRGMNDSQLADHHVFVSVMSFTGTGKSTFVKLFTDSTTPYFYGEITRSYLFDDHALSGAEEWLGERALESKFKRSQWFTRGWTLQEILGQAPTYTCIVESAVKAHPAGRWLICRRQGTKPEKVLEIKEPPNDCRSKIVDFGSSALRQSRGTEPSPDTQQIDDMDDVWSVEAVMPEVSTCELDEDVSSAERILRNRRSKVRLLRVRARRLCLVARKLFLT